MSYGNQPGNPEDHNPQQPGGGYGQQGGYGQGGYPPPGGGYGYGQAPYGGGGVPPVPDNHLVAAILTTLFCCLPFGIVSIIKSSQVNSKWAVGDYQGAVIASEEAKTWWKRAIIWGIVVDVVVIVGYFALLAMLFTANSYAP